MDNANKYCLIGKIKGLAEQAQHTRLLIKKATKEERVWDLCMTKRALGIDTRHHLLAYSLLKGKPYRLMEGKCRADNLPNPEVIFKIMEAHENRYSFERLWSLEKVKAWLGDESIKAPEQPLPPKRSPGFIEALRNRLGI